MADSSLVTALIGLGGTVIGLGGGLLIQLVLEKRKQEFERQKQEYEKQKETKRKKAEKLEELACELYAHESWLIQVQNRISQGDKALDVIMTKLPTPPLPKAQVIANMYFPELKGDLAALSAACAQEPVARMAATATRTIAIKGRTRNVVMNERGSSLAACHRCK
jgi:predicted ribosome quality control (RQC) complex YloA/Tae2 family protein